MLQRSNNHLAYKCLKKRNNSDIVECDRILNQKKIKWKWQNLWVEKEFKISSEAYFWRHYHGRQLISSFCSEFSLRNDFPGCPTKCSMEKCYFIIFFLQNMKVKQWDWIFFLSQIRSLKTAPKMKLLKYSPAWSVVRIG